MLAVIWRESLDFCEPERKGTLILEDGFVSEGYSFGSSRAVSGEVVFNTGMVGLPAISPC
jgi:hypothetical protein